MDKAIPFERRALSASDIATMLGCCTRNVRERLAAKPGFPSRCDLGGQPRWLASDIIEWMETNKTKRKGAPKSKQDQRRTI